MVGDKEEIKQNDGEESFEPEPCTTARDGVGFEAILERLREGEPYKTEAGERWICALTVVSEKNGHT